jgi:PAS domain S-box-containing protein
VVAEDTSRMLFRAVEQSPVAVMVTDPGGRIEYVNDAFTAMTGFGRDEVVGHHPGPHDAETESGQTFGEMWRAIKSGREWRGEVGNRRKDGSPYWESVTVAPVLGADGGVVNYIALKEDISERRAAEATQAAARQAAELANRAKSEFLAAMSHELRTPLNAIIGFSEIMATQPFGEIAPKYREYLADINHSGRHLLRVIDDILDVARLDVGRLALREEEVDVETLVSAAVTMVRERAEAGGITVAADGPEELPTLWADARRLKQVLVNVLANAVKFSLRGGRVAISAARSADGGLQFVVSDTGIGIAPEQLARVMSPFVQADSGLARRYEGSGLGLPLARQLMELHGGGLHLESALGHGTTVTLTLPPERVLANRGIG